VDARCGKKHDKGRARVVSLLLVVSLSLSLSFA